MERLRRAAVPLVSGVAYVLTAARTIQGGDSGELAAIGSTGGAAHPPGYPLFVIWCRLWHWLPATSPAHRIALCVAILGALAVYTLERAARAWGASEAAAAIAAAIFAVSPLSWRLSTEPEVFALNIVLCLAIVRVAAPAPWAREERRAILLALLAGLGLANHHSSILIAPLGLFAWGRAVRHAERRGLAVGLSLVGLAVGLAPYGYLMVSKSDCAWGDTSSVRGLLVHLFRSEYGTTQLASSIAKPEPLGQLVWLGDSFVTSGIAFTLGAAALYAMRARRWSWPVAMLAASLALAGPIFAMRFNLPPRGLMAHVVERFHLLPLALGSVLGAFGIDAVLGRLRNDRPRAAALVAIFGIIVLRGALTLQSTVAAHRATTQRYVENVLAFVPPRSIVVAVGDDLTGGFEYLQCARGERRDVVVIAPALLLSDWYAARTSAALGAPIEHGAKGSDGRPTLSASRLVRDLLATGRPVFMTDWFAPKLESDVASYPIGPLIRLSVARTDVPSPPALLEQNNAVFAAFALDVSVPPPHTWAGVRYRDYARPWLTLANSFDVLDENVAKRCRTRAAAFLPSSEDAE